MFSFLMGIAVGAAGFWAYRFWKGDDSSWDQSFGSGSGSESFGSYGQQPVGGSSSVNAVGSGTASSASSTSGVQTTPE